MTKYIALLRGINVGGKNKISMEELKAVFEREGFLNVVTYINSGNILFDSDLDESSVKAVCEELITTNFDLDIPIGIITNEEIAEAITNAPEWWNRDPDAKHNAIFVISPATAKEICEQIGIIKPEYEKMDYYGKVIFWSAPVKTFSRTRLSKAVHDTKINRKITVRNANTTIRLMQM